MSVSTGQSWKLARYSGTTPYNIGGIPSRPRVIKHVANELEVGTGQRRLVNLQATNIYWEIAWRMKVQRLDFINSYGMITAEGTLPSCGLYVHDGNAGRGYTGAYIDSIAFDVGQTGSMTAELVALAIANETKTLTVTYDTDSPITKTGLTLVQVGATTIAKWTSLRWGISNNVEKEATGSGNTITELFARHPVYSGRLQFVKTANPLFGYDETMKQTIVIRVVDNQTVPVTKTYTFTNAAVRTDEINVEELNLSMETIDWQGDMLTIT